MYANLILVLGTCAWAVLVVPGVIVAVIGVATGVATVTLLLLLLARLKLDVNVLVIVLGMLLGRRILSLVMSPVSFR